MQAQVGGKIAQLGARLIDATAKSMADQFFDRFTQRLTLGEVDAAGRAAGGRCGAPPAPPPPAAISPLSLIPREPFGLPIVAWVGLAIFIFILVLLFGTSL